MSEHDFSTGAGGCVRSGQAIVSGHESLACGHCEAACPVEAVRVGALANDSQQFTTFRQQADWLAPGRADIASLVQLMRSRRSCRHYQDRPVPLAVLQDLIKIGLTAPSGSNCQPWVFTLLPSRAAVSQLGGLIATFFHRLNRMADRRLLRGALKIISLPDLDFYYRNYRDAVE